MCVCVSGDEEICDEMVSGLLLLLLPPPPPPPPLPTVRLVELYKCDNEQFESERPHETPKPFAFGQLTRNWCACSVFLPRSDTAPRILSRHSDDGETVNQYSGRRGRENTSFDVSVLKRT